MRVREGTARTFASRTKGIENRWYTLTLRAALTVFAPIGLRSGEHRPFVRLDFSCAEQLRGRDELQFANPVLHREHRESAQRPDVVYSLTPSANNHRGGELFIIINTRRANEIDR